MNFKVGDLAKSKLSGGVYKIISIKHGHKFELPILGECVKEPIKFLKVQIGERLRFEIKDLDLVKNQNHPYTNIFK